MSALENIDTFVVLMLENRSFDHMLGYLSLSGSNANGLSNDPSWLQNFTNDHAGKSYPIHRLGADVTSISDPPHDRAPIAKQINTRCTPGGCPELGGFVQSYATSAKPPRDLADVMGYYDAQTLPAFDFLARHYTICDSWFAPLPSGTQPNRLMAMAGESAISDNVQGLKFIPDQALAYDWLRERGIPWCVYQSGSVFPFFSLMKKWLPEIITSLTLPHDDVGGSFRRYTRFAADWQSDAIMPKVIFIEPEYTDGPNCNPNDDHSPTGVAPGQDFVADVYRTLTSNADRWKNTLLIVTYDEHGGFFDHVSPLRLPDNVAGFAFETTGLRVPAILASPYVSAGGVFSGNLDHTSILQLLAEKFDSNRIYSPAVSARNKYLDSLSSALNTSATAGSPPALAGGDNASFKAPFNGELNAGQSEVNQGFHAVALQIARDHPQVLTSPQWTNLAQYISTYGKH